MKIAIPTVDGRLCMHFGHCDEFAIIEVDDKTGLQTPAVFVNPPPHEPGLLPRWLHEMGANAIIAGGMGQRAQQLFLQNGISVHVGAPVDTPENLVAELCKGTLSLGQNTCDH